MKPWIGGRHSAGGADTPEPTGPRPHNPGTVPEESVGAPSDVAQGPAANPAGAHASSRRFGRSAASGYVRGPCGPMRRSRPPRRPGRGWGGVFRIRGPVLLGGAAVLIALTVLLTCLFYPRPRQEGPVFLNEALGVPVRTVLLSENSAGRPGTKREIRYLVIHETGNPGENTGAKSHSNYLQAGGDGRGTSWHYTVDDHEIYHHIPDDEVAYHASSADGNTYGVGVELCVNEDGDFERTFDNGARLAACLLKAYGLPVDALRQHGDFTEKNCPETIRNTGRWGEFKEKVKSYLKGLDE